MLKLALKILVLQQKDSLLEVLLNHVVGCSLLSLYNSNEGIVSGERTFLILQGSIPGKTLYRLTDGKLSK